MSQIGTRKRIIHVISNGSSSILALTYKIMASGLRPEEAVPGGASCLLPLLEEGTCRLEICHTSGSSCEC
eukprot:1345398-Prymnesium_polylepis.1